MAEQLICVPPDRVDDIWPHVTGLIEKAVIEGRGDLSLAQVQKGLNAGKSLLWIVWCERDGQYRADVKAGELLAAVTTELIQIDGGRKFCIITTCAGRDLQRWVRLISEIEDYARKEACDAVRLFGRPGWVRYLKDRGYAQPWIAVEKAVR